GVPAPRPGRPADRHEGHPYVLIDPPQRRDRQPHRRRLAQQLLKLRGIPILVYTLVTADRVEQISQIVLNYPPQWREDVEPILKAYAISTPVTLVEAGSSRHSSVAAMIPHCTNDDVIIHETARPLVRTDDFQRLIDSEHRNVSLMSEISFTVAPVDPET